MQMLRLVNQVSWQPTLSCPHTALVSDQDSTVVYKEVEEMVSGISRKSTSAKYVVPKLPISIQVNKPPTDKPDPKLGVGKFATGCDLLSWPMTGRQIFAESFDDDPCLVDCSRNTVTRSVFYQIVWPKSMARV